MLDAIESSRDYILGEFYLVESGVIMNQFLDAFGRAAGRGVRVRLLLDAFGARGLTEPDRARLRSSGLELVLYNLPRWRTLESIFLRDHRKLLAVDGRVGFTGGAGLTDAFSPDVRPATHWSDCMVRIEGPVLGDWETLFARTWRRSAHRRLDVELQSGAPLVPGERGRLAISAGLGRKDVGRSVIRQVRMAQRRVWIATAYFWPSSRLRRALRRAARRGVDVRLVLAGPQTDTPAARSVGRLFYARLLANRVVIYEYQPRFLHTKLVLCDDWASIGSSNLDRWGALWNLDANQEIDSPGFAGQVEAFFERTYRDSVAIRSAGAVEHPWNVRFWQLFARAVFAWSARAIARLRR